MLACRGCESRHSEAGILLKLLALGLIVLMDTGLLVCRLQAELQFVTGRRDTAEADLAGSRAEAARQLQGRDDNIAMVQSGWDFSACMGPCPRGGYTAHALSGHPPATVGKKKQSA